MHPSISLITLGVTDFDRSLKFYRDGLGWKTDAKEGDPVAFFQLSGCILGLFPRTELAADAGVDETGSGFRGFSIAHNTRSKEEADEVFALAKKIGATIVKEPHETSWGGYSGYFADPDGFLWEVAWNPHWKFDERGNVML